VSGLFAAILGGSIVSSALLCMRFRYLARRGRNEILRESVPTPL
jgi:hypothetical protein